MKFEVTKSGWDDRIVEVRLHDDTKDKIKKIFYWTVSIASLAVIVNQIRDNKRIEKETPTE